MGTLAALLQTLGGVTSATGKAKEELAAEDQRKRQLYSQLETAALQRDHLRQQMRLAEGNPLAKQISQIESAIGRKLTDEEKQRHFGIAAKEQSSKIVTKLEQDKNSKTGWSYVSYDPLSGREYSRQLDAPPQRGLIESETRTTDPLTGLTTVSHRKPLLGGAGTTPPASPSAVPSKPASPQASPRATLAQLLSTGTGQKPQGPSGAGRASGKGKSTPQGQKPPATATAALGKPSGKGTAPLPLDAEGHIPAGTMINPHVREAANELLDGQDKLKIQPSKLADVAANVARRYGWEQGKFTPKEQTLLREVTTFLQRAMTDGSMAALDSGPMDRLKLQQIMQNPDKENFIGRGASMLAARGMTPQQQQFVQTYNQLVGTISGLAQLVRSNRATEATIERLKAELPNPTNTRDSKDAQQRLQRLMDEINVGIKKGTFTGPEGSQDPAKTLVDRVLKGGSSAPR